jgi:MFS transporter, DHA1 family, multidrug resistance protein
MLWLSGPIFLLMFFCLPETSASTILLHRARRLRKLTGNNKLKSQGEIDEAHLTVNEVVLNSLWRPMQIAVLDPAVTFANVYSSLVYGIYYSFFEVFPLVYPAMYGFNLGELGLTFLSIIVAVVLAICVYSSYMYFVVEPRIKKHGLFVQERWLIPALIASFLPPIGLFLFGNLSLREIANCIGWTSRPSVHWIASVIGIGIYTTGVFTIFQCVFIYIPLTYPQYAASLFAANDFSRSCLAAGAILFARPLFINLGVGPGISLLAGLTCACVVNFPRIRFELTMVSSVSSSYTSMVRNFALDRNSL